MSKVASTGVALMMLSHDPSFAGADWDISAIVRPRTLDLDNTVYVRFRDNAGNVSQTYSVECSFRPAHPINEWQDGNLRGRLFLAKQPRHPSRW